MLFLRPFCLETLLVQWRPHVVGPDPRTLQLAGAALDVRDASCRWYTGRVLDVREPDQVLVHFDGTVDVSKSVYCLGLFVAL